MDNTNYMNNMNYMNNVNNINNISYVRLLHASPKAPSVNVFIDDKLLVKGFEYREFTDYVKLYPKTYNIKIYKSSNPKELLYETDFELKDNKIFTIAAVGEFPSDFKLFPIEENYTENQNLDSTKTKFRVVNLIPNQSNLDITLGNGTVLFRDVMYMEVENYIELTPRSYTFNITLTNTNIDILYVPNINLKMDRFYTMYIIGLIDDKPSPQVLVPLDGITYLNF